MLGRFTFYFSKLEFLLLDLCTFTELPNPKSKYLDFIGLSLDDKRNIIKNFVNANIPKLKQEWEKINVEIGVINQDRRFLVHGIGESYNLYDDKIRTISKVKGKLILKEYDSNDINKLTNRISHVNTGKNGIGGIFNSKFKTESCNYYNLGVEDLKKIVFKDNNTVMTDWKGIKI